MSVFVRRRFAIGEDDFIKADDVIHFVGWRAAYANLFQKLRHHYTELVFRRTLEHSIPDERDRDPIQKGVDISWYIRCLRYS